MMLKILVFLFIFSFLDQKMTSLAVSYNLLKAPKVKNNDNDTTCFMKFKNVDKTVMSRIKFLLNKSRKDNEPSERQLLKQFADVVKILQETNPTSLVKIGVVYLDSSDNYRKHNLLNPFRVPAQICKIAVKNGLENNLHKSLKFRRQINLPFIRKSKQQNNKTQSVGKNKKFNVIY